MFFTSLLVWIGKYYLTETHASINALDERIRLLETEVARKGDVQFVAKQIDDMRHDVMAELLRR